MLYIAAGASKFALAQFQITLVLSSLAQKQPRTPRNVNNPIDLKQQFTDHLGRSQVVIDLIG